MNRTKAVGCTRVSTEEQATAGVSLPAQHERITTYATLRGLHLIGIVEDPGVSGAKPLLTRPGGARLAVALREGAEAIIVVKLDRAFRDAADALTTTRSWDRRNIALHIIDLGGASVDSRSAAGRFMLTVLAGAAEMERGLVRERTRTALAHLRRQGRVTNHVELGFDERAGRLVPSEEEMATVLRISELRSGGASLRAIATTLVEEGRSTKRGGRWSPETIRKVLRRQAERLLVERPAVNAGTRVDGVAAGDLGLPTP